MRLDQGNDEPLDKAMGYRCTEVDAAVHRLPNAKQVDWSTPGTVVTARRDGPQGSVYVTKIYRAITAGQLEQYTSDGWTWDNVERREQRIIEERDTEGRLMTIEERKVHGYHDGYSAPRIYNHKHFFGDVLIFIVWKEKETIDREQAAESRAFTAEHKLQQLNEEAQKHAKAIEVLNKQLEETQAIARTRQEQIWARDEKNRKLEGDISKIRTVVGTDKMNEILGVKPS